MLHLLYNPHADGGKGTESAQEAAAALQGDGLEVNCTDSASIELNEFCNGLKEGDELAILGGDGTLNYFINHIEEIPNVPVYLYAAGTGNDFLNDIKEYVEPVNNLYRINNFLVGLPRVEVKGKTYRFINGIGFGVDGECCVVAEEKLKAGETDINYSKISISLLLGPFIPRKATVTIDGGEPLTFEGVWLASCMNGRYYGGGMKIAPDQKRNSDSLTFVCVNKKGRIRTLLAFPGIQKGKHVGKKWAYFQQGKCVEVTFDQPCGLQIDGEVVPEVTTYKAYLA